MLVLPWFAGGCFTTALWGDDAGPQLVEVVTTAGVEEWTRAGEIRPGRDRLHWTATDGGQTFELRPEQDAEPLLRLLGEAASLAEPFLALTTDAERIDGEPAGDQTWLLLECHPPAIGFVERVDAARLPPPTAQALLAGAPPTLRDRDPSGHELPTAEQQAALALLAPGFAEFVGLEGGARIAAFVFVDGEDLPLRFADRATATGAPLTDIRDTPLLARFRGVAGDTTLRIRCDQLQHFAALASFGGSIGPIRHRSRWSVVELPSESFVPTVPAAGRTALRADWTVRETAKVTSLVERPSESAFSLWEKLALTPVTLSLDLLFGWIGSLLGLDEDEPPLARDGTARAPRSPSRAAVVPRRRTP